MPISAARGVEDALNILEGRWKLGILFHLFGGKVLRFSHRRSELMPAVRPHQLNKPSEIRCRTALSANPMRRRALHRRLPHYLPMMFNLLGQTCLTYEIFSRKIAYLFRRVLKKVST